ncbi:hypothetical protein [Limnohabitans parvus]|uniref:hypothetical protein n=1 Tax=Limnohabitans parvus TaxID=540061 RepID=UPI0011B24928|nr:hypothetical protein [Limnohabitans parvus]
MLIKINCYTAKQRQRVCEISRLIRYLLVGRGPGQSLVRLAGPPFCRNLIQRHNPFGGEMEESATDIAKQLTSSVLSARIGDSRPHDLCTHVIMSIPPRYRSRNALKSLDFNEKNSDEGTYVGALRIALDILDMLAIDHRLALYCVVHADRRHMHIHAIVGRFAYGARDLVSDRSSFDLIRISKTIDERYSLCKGGAAFKNSHRQATNALV